MAASAKPSDEQQPGFNAPNVASGGILIVNSAGEVVAASPDAPPFDGALRDFVDQVAPGRSATGPLTIDARGEPTMTFVVPLFAVQSDQATSAQIGRIVGVKRVGEELYPLLRQPGDTTRSATTVLLTRDGNKVTYLSPIVRPGETPQPLGHVDGDVDAQPGCGLCGDGEQRLRARPAATIPAGAWWWPRAPSPARRGC